MATHWWSIAVDAHDPQHLARWWSEVLEYPVEELEEEVATLLPPHRSGPRIEFLPVSDEKTVKNRLHIDLNPTDRDAEVERLLGMGATRVDVGQSPDVTWVVLADPEGNEFCVLQPRQS